jgi:hypothetical protein
VSHGQPAESKPPAESNPGAGFDGVAGAGRGGAVVTAGRDVAGGAVVTTGGGGAGGGAVTAGRATARAIGTGARLTGAGVARGGRGRRIGMVGSGSTFCIRSTVGSRTDKGSRACASSTRGGGAPRPSAVTATAAPNASATANQKGIRAAFMPTGIGPRA